MSERQQGGLELVPVSFSDAAAFIKQVHRHHKLAVGTKFCVGVALGGRIVAVGMAGRPVARHLDDGWTVEVNRVASDGTRNACSMTYGALWRAARALGYRRAVTYTLASEPGTSLRASGWRVVHEVKGRSWNTPSRPRTDKHPTQNKLRWEP